MNWLIVLGVWLMVSVIASTVICRIIHNDKAREAGQGRFTA